MKWWLAGLVFYTLFSCHAESISSGDLLYQRWKAIDSDYYLTFLPEGIILHGNDGRDAYCCSPRYFLRLSNRLDLKNAPVKPLPKFVQEANCSLVKCAGPGEFWEILALDSQQLVLKTPYGTVIYQPYP